MKRQVTLLAALAALALAFVPRAEAFVYWTNSVGIGRADLDGSNAEAFVSDDLIATGVAVDEHSLYWARSGAGGPGFIGRANIDGSGANPTFLPGAQGPGDSLPLVNARVSAVAVDRAHVYWINGFGSEPDKIGRADLDGSNLNQSFFPVKGDLYALAVGGGHIYWTGDGGIGRADLDGSNVNQSFIPGEGSFVSGIAVNSTHLFWGASRADGSINGSIGRADLDGSNVDDTFITVAERPTDVAVDAAHVYWTSRNLGRIGRADLDGSDVDPTFISGLLGLHGVEVDALSTPPPPPAPPPEFTRTLSLSYAARKGKFKGKLESQSPACVTDKVKIFEKEKGKDPKVGSDTTSEKGKYSLKEKNADGKFFATVNQTSVPGGTCLAARSETIKVG